MAMGVDPKMNKYAELRVTDPIAARAYAEEHGLNVVPDDQGMMGDFQSKSLGKAKAGLNKLGAMIGGSPSLTQPAPQQTANSLPKKINLTEPTPPNPYDEVPIVPNDITRKQISDFNSTVGVEPEEEQLTDFQKQIRKANEVNKAAAIQKLKDKFKNVRKE